MGPVEEGTDASDSHIFYVIRAAQEKEEVSGNFKIFAKLAITHFSSVTCQFSKFGLTTFCFSISLLFKGINS